MDNLAPCELDPELVRVASVAICIALAALLVVAHIAYRKRHRFEVCDWATSSAHTYTRDLGATLSPRPAAAIIQNPISCENCSVQIDSPTITKPGDVESPEKPIDQERQQQQQWRPVTLGTADTVAETTSPTIIGSRDTLASSSLPLLPPPSLPALCLQRCILPVLEEINADDIYETVQEQYTVTASRVHEEWAKGQPHQLVSVDSAITVGENPRADVATKTDEGRGGDQSITEQVGERKPNQRAEQELPVNMDRGRGGSGTPLQKSVVFLEPSRSIEPKRMVAFAKQAPAVTSRTALAGWPRRIASFLFCCSH